MFCPFALIQDQILTWLRQSPYRFSNLCSEIICSELPAPRSLPSCIPACYFSIHDFCCLFTLRLFFHYLIVSFTYHFTVIFHVCWMFFALSWSVQNLSVPIQVKREHYIHCLLLTLLFLCRSLVCPSQGLLNWWLIPLKLTHQIVIFKYIVQISTHNTIMSNLLEWISR